ncbi:MAG TPA: sigma-70 family RNA polymerase sigma factor [Blastocatellia bacterium]|nr:sigma-70 family RNA polymerase sigma factor [Blastocatellia bacterium]
MAKSEEITELLIQWNNGDEMALEKLIPLVERELRRMARRYMRREDPNHTLQTTALINEAYLKLIKQRDVQWQNRAHFYAIAAQLMRRVLLDHARTQKRQKRGGDVVQVDLSETAVLTDEKLDELIALDQALEKLAQFDPLKSQIVEMRYFGGLSVEETAEVTKLAAVTVMRHWNLAKAWLRRELRSTLSED